MAGAIRTQGQGSSALPSSCGLTASSWARSAASTAASLRIWPRASARYCATRAVRTPLVAMRASSFSASAWLAKLASASLFTARKGTPSYISPGAPSM